MIILDTNVVSGLMRAEPDAPLLAWLNDQPTISVWTTVITVLETHFGLAIMPTGRRRNLLEREFEQFLETDIDGRVLDFDRIAAEEAAALMARRKATGRIGEWRDSMIAGIALARRATLATRNARHFADLSVPVVDPWSAR